MLKYKKTKVDNTIYISLIKSTLKNYINVNTRVILKNV